MPSEPPPGVIAERLEAIGRDVKRIEQNLEKRYVTQEEFRPVRALMDGFVGLIMTGFIGAVIALVFKVAK